MGGVNMLRALGHTDIELFHMNEGHSSLLTLALLNERARQAGRTAPSRADVDAVRRQCVFTTHTPVPAGHDQFPLELANRVLRQPELTEMQDVFCYNGVLNMTYLALNMSHYVNGVAKRHAEDLAPNVRAIRHRCDHQWGTRGHLGLHPISRAFRSVHSGWQENNLRLR